MRVEQQRQHQLFRQAHRGVDETDSPLVADDFPLGFQVRLIDPEVSHPVGLDVHGQFDLPRREVLEIGGVVRCRERIERSAAGLPIVGVPLNIMCSKRCEIPVRPGRSLRDPTA